MYFNLTKRTYFTYFVKIAWEKVLNDDNFSRRGVTFFLFTPCTSLDYEDEADTIWTFQKNLAAIIAFLTGADNNHNPYFLYQFNEKDA